MGADEVWEIANETKVRGVSVSLWPEELDPRLLKEQITAATTALAMWPASFYFISRETWTHKSKKWRSESEINFETYENIGGISVRPSFPARGQNVPILIRSIYLSQDFRHLYFEGPPDFLTLELAKNLFEKFLPFISPRYGFSDISRWGDCYAFHRGQPTSGMDDLQTARADAFDQIRGGVNQKGEGHLKDHLLDVYELNFLSAEHLKIQVQGKSLKQWILAGDRGSLEEFGKSLHAWTVPDTVRTDIRSLFLKEGLLVVPV